MGEVVQDADREFWRAPVVPATDAEPSLAEACPGCGTEFVMRAGFCHVCGAQRNQTPLVAARPWTRHFEFHHIKAIIGLRTASLVAFFIGVTCALAAVLVGFVFSVNTVLDWQAIQVWRIEWLLGSAAAFLAGILLAKRK